MESYFMLMNATREKTGDTRVKRAGVAGENVDPKLVLKSVAHPAKDSASSLENTSYRHGRGRILGISPLPFGRFAPSESVEMTDINSKGEASILTPLAIENQTRSQILLGAGITKEQRPGPVEEAH
jgi:hypothetical protein